MSFFSSIEKEFSNIGQAVSNAIRGAAQTVSSDVHWLGSQLTSGAETVEHDIASAIQPIGTAISSFVHAPPAPTVMPVSATTATPTQDERSAPPSPHPINIAPAIPQPANWFSSAVSQAERDVSNFATSAVSQIQRAVGGGMQWLENQARNAAQAAETLTIGAIAPVQPIASKLGSELEGGISALQSAGKQLVSDVDQLRGDLAKAAPSALQGVEKQIVSGAEWAGKQLSPALQTAGKELASVAEQAAKAYANQALNTATEAVYLGAKAVAPLVGVNPKKITKKEVKDVIEKTAEEAAKTVESGVQWVGKQVQPYVNSVVQLGEERNKQFVNLVKEGINLANKAIHGQATTSDYLKFLRDTLTYGKDVGMDALGVVLEGTGLGDLVRWAQAAIQDKSLAEVEEEWKKAGYDQQAYETIGVPLFLALGGIGALGALSDAADVGAEVGGRAIAKALAIQFGKTMARDAGIGALAAVAGALERCSRGFCDEAAKAAIGNFFGAMNIGMAIDAFRFFEDTGLAEKAIQAGREAAEKVFAREGAEEAGEDAGSWLKDVGGKAKSSISWSTDSEVKKALAEAEDQVRNFLDAQSKDTLEKLSKMSDEELRQFAEEHGLHPDLLAYHVKGEPVRGKVPELQWLLGKYEKYEEMLKALPQDELVDAYRRGLLEKYLDEHGLPIFDKYTPPRERDIIKEVVDSYLDELGKGVLDKTAAKLGIDPNELEKAWLSQGYSLRDLLKLSPAEAAVDLDAAYKIMLKNASRGEGDFIQDLANAVKELGPEPETKTAESDFIQDLSNAVKELKGEGEVESKAGGETGEKPTEKAPQPEKTEPKVLEPLPIQTAELSPELTAKLETMAKQYGYDPELVKQAAIFSAMHGGSVEDIVNMDPEWAESALKRVVDKFNDEYNRAVLSIARRLGGEELAGDVEKAIREAGLTPLDVLSEDDKTILEEIGPYLEKEGGIQFLDKSKIEFRPERELTSEEPTGEEGELSVEGGKDNKRSVGEARDRGRRNRGGG
jgi:predicted transcriptional regulator